MNSGAREHGGVYLREVVANQDQAGGRAKNKQHRASHDVTLLASSTSPRSAYDLPRLQEAGSLEDIKATYFQPEDVLSNQWPNQLLKDGRASSGAIESARSRKPGAQPRNRQRYPMSRLNKSNANGPGPKVDSLAAGSVLRGHVIDHLVGQQLSPRASALRDATLSSHRLSLTTANTKHVRAPA